MHVVFTWYDPRETYQQNLLRVKSQVHARLKRFVCQQCVVPGTMAGRHTRTCTSLMPGGISWAVGPRCNFVGAEAIEAYSHLPGTQPSYPTSTRFCGPCFHGLCILQRWPTATSDLWRDSEQKSCVEAP